MQIKTLPKAIMTKVKRILFKDTFRAPELSKKAIVNLLGKKHCAEHPVIVEIGCADGLDTLEFLKAFGNCDFKIYCFEPDPRNIASFKANVHDPRVTLIEMAVSDTDGKMTLHQSSTIYSSSLKKPNMQNLNKAWPDIAFNNTFDVATITIDTFMKQYDIARIDFIWADVQGAEDLMLRGARKSLVDKIKYIYTEYSTKEFYAQSPSLEKIKELAGPHWKIAKDYGTDVLLKNDTIAA